MDHLFTLPLRLDTRALPTFTRDEVLVAVRRAVAARRDTRHAISLDETVRQSLLLDLSNFESFLVTELRTVLAERKDRRK